VRKFLGSPRKRLEQVPGSHYYLRLLSWTSRTFYFPNSRDLLEVLRDFLGRGRGGGPQGILPDPRGSSLGASLSAREVFREPREGSENLGSRRSWRSEIMNASNNDYGVLLFHSLARGIMRFSRNDESRPMNIDFLEKSSFSPMEK